MKNDLSFLREQFPLLQKQVRGKNLVYLDSAATTLKPKPMIDRISQFYAHESANVHRGAYSLSDEATQLFEASRARIAKFIGADAEEIVFVRGTTEGINLVAGSFGQSLKADDGILLTELEHHANIVPWQLLAEKRKLRVEAVQVTPSGELDLEDCEKKLRSGIKFFSVTGCSNTLGTMPALKGLIAKAQGFGAKVLIDAAQLISQQRIQVKELGADFLVFSGHKIFGPTGIGVLYAKKEILEQMPPWQGGGSMISHVSFEGTTFNDPPFRFEAGTPHIAGAIGLSAAVDWFSQVDIEDVHSHEQRLLKQATDRLREIPEISLYGDLPQKGAILSFNLNGAHHSDVAQILDQQGVAVRAGHHCTQPLMKRLGVPGTLRASFSIYNNTSDVEKLVEALKKAMELLK